MKRMLQRLRAWFARVTDTRFAPDHLMMGFDPYDEEPKARDD